MAYDRRNILEESRRSAEEEATKRAELSTKFENCFKVPQRGRCVTFTHTQPNAAKLTRII
jgi:hypothetical protein